MKFSFSDDEYFYHTIHMVKQKTALMFFTSLVSRKIIRR